MTEQYANTAQTTLNGAIDNSTTTVVVTSAAAFPSSGDFRILIDSELMLVTSVSSNTFTVSTRGTIESTSAASHSNGATVTHVLTAASLAALLSGAVVLLAEIILSGDGVIEFTGIPAGYRDLRLIGKLRATTAATERTELGIRVGDGSFDTGSNYYWVRNSVFADANHTAAQSNSDTKLVAGSVLLGATATSGRFGTIDYLFPAYDSVTHEKHVQGFAGFKPANSTGQMGHGWFNGAWTDTNSPIERISLYPTASGTMLSGSEARLYGVTP